jgi:hypothetical protein
LNERSSLSSTLAAVDCPLASGLAFAGEMRAGCLEKDSSWQLRR